MLMSSMIMIIMRLTRWKVLFVLRVFVMQIDEFPDLASYNGDAGKITPRGREKLKHNKPVEYNYIFIQKINILNIMIRYRLFFTPKTMNELEFVLFSKATLDK